MENKADKNEPPVGADGQPMRKFEVRQRISASGKPERQIWIDKEMFEWSVDADSLAEMRKAGPAYFEAAKSDIQNHFLDSLSEFLGRKVSDKDIIKAHINGWI